MTSEELRSLILDCLRDRLHDQTQLQIPHLFYDIAELAKKRGLKYKGTHNAWLDGHGRAELYPNLKAPASDIFWDLIIEGILRPGDGRATSELLTLPHVHITALGKKTLEGHFTPYDPEGYIKNLKEKVPSVDPVILKYIAESAATLRANCLLSSTVTLGCASEKAFLLLADAYRDSLDSANQARFGKGLAKTRGIKQYHEIFMKDYENILRPKLKGSQSSDWLSELDNALNFVFSYFRDMRNAAGHPTGKALSGEVVASHLVVFPHYLRLLYECREWIDANKPL